MLESRGQSCQDTETSFGYRECFYKTKRNGDVFFLPFSLRLVVVVVVVVVTLVLVLLVAKTILLALDAIRKAVETTKE